MSVYAASSLDGASPGAGYRPGLEVTETEGVECRPHTKEGGWQMVPPCVSPDYRLWFKSCVCAWHPPAGEKASWPDDAAGVSPALPQDPQQPQDTETDWGGGPAPPPPPPPGQG